MNSIILFLKKKIKNKRAIKNFYKINKHCYMKIGNINYSNNVIVGNFTYGVLNYTDYYDGSKLIIGNYCSIAEDVSFCIGGEHNYKAFMNYPFKSSFSSEHYSFSKGDIIVEDDVWIGRNSLIMSGVKIGKGAVVGAGSLVVNDVPPFAIVGGNPAKIIKYRFSDEIISKLLVIDYSKISKDLYLKNKELFDNDFSEKIFEILL